MPRNRALSRQARKVLTVLLSGPVDWRHGYELAKLSGLSSGTLYPLLIRFHERGFLEAKWVEAERPGRPPRHAYRLSAKGAAFARSIESEIDEGRPAVGEPVIA